MTSSNSNNAKCVEVVEDCDVTDFLLFQSTWEAPLWTREATLSLIECYKQYRPRVGSAGIRHMHQLWEIVSNDLKKVVSTYFTPSQCENRWRVLERNFRKFKKSSGRSRKAFEFQKELEGLVSLEKSHIHHEPLFAGIVLTESPETISFSEKHEGYSEPGTLKISSKEHACQSPPSKRRMKMKLSPGDAKVDDRRNQMGQERSKGREEREEQSLEIQKNILKTLQEANELHREAVNQMAEHNKQMAEHNAILRKYMEYRMSHSGFQD